MKNGRTWLLIIYAVLMFFLFRNMLFNNQGQSITEDPNEVFQKIVAYEEKAGDDEVLLKKTIGEYNSFEKKFSKESPEKAAEAHLRVALIQETKIHKEMYAVRTYKALIKKYSKRAPEIVAEAKKNLADLEIRVDKMNSIQPGYKAIDFLVGLTGYNPKLSYAVALLAITILVKLVTLPLTHAQMKSMKEMQKVQPLLKQLQEKYKGDQKTIGEKTMALYKEHGVNPFASCLPMFIQMGMLLLLYYKVILVYQFQFTKGEFLWIGSALSEKYPSILATDLSQLDVPLLLIYAVSMYVSQKLTVVDPSQAEQQKLMAIALPIVFTGMSWWYAFPSALMLYWLMFNVFTTWQQYTILRPSGGAAPPQPGITSGPGDKAEVVPPQALNKPKGNKKKKKFEAIDQENTLILPVLKNNFSNPA